jgi:hypothetical protein
MLEDNDRIIWDKTFREMLGGVSHMFVRRRDENPPPGWPQQIWIGRRSGRSLLAARRFVLSPGAGTCINDEVEEKEARRVRRERLRRL